MANKKNNKKALTRDAIRKADDLALVEHPVPEWDGVVYLKPMKGDEREEFEEVVQKVTVKGQVKTKGLRVKMIIASVRDEEGAPIFTDADTSWLQEKNACAISHIFAKLSEMNGLTEKDKKEIEGN